MERPDDAPPPPYSEVDIYSASMPSALRSSPAGQNADDASVTASSSHSNIIYTPPETPDAQDGWAAAGGTDASPLPASAHTSNFAARPAAGRPPSSAHIVHAIHLAEGMTPADLPYPGWAADRQIAEQDWHDFVIHLFPLYAEKASEYIADRKPRAEREGTPSEAGRTIAETQLDPTQCAADASRRKQGFEVALRTVQHWNEGFFAPHGVTLRLDAAPDFPDVPRAWDHTAFDASRELPHQSDCGGPIGRPSEAGNRGMGRGWPRGRGMPGGLFSGAIRGCRGVQGEPGPHNHHEHGFGWHDPARRSHSRSSASSDSSSSSSGSDSSVGSLPDWDELNASQLSILRGSVGSWVHSALPVSKAEYKRVKAEIKAVEGTPGARQAGNAGQRKETKQLLAQWKEVQKSQKTAKKAARKVAMKEKKVRKRERKAAKKEGEKNKKDHRHAERETRRDAPTAGAHAHSAFGPAPPDAPPPVKTETFGPAPGLDDPSSAGPGAGGFGSGWRGGPGPFGFLGGGRGGWSRGPFGGPRAHPPGAWPSGAAAIRHAHAVRDGALREAAANRQAALATADRARHDAAATAAAAVRHAHTARDAALHDARRQRAEAAAQAHGARDAALATADRARHNAAATAAAAVRHAHTARDAALHDARRQGAEATARAHGARDAALRDAAASRQEAQAVAARARDEALRHQARWQPWGQGPGAAVMSAGTSSQVPYSPCDRDRANADEARPSAGADLQTHYVQQEKREASAAQIGQEDASVAAPARQDRAAEIHELENRLAALRMQADEALARQLAEEEARGGPPS